MTRGTLHDHTCEPSRLTSVNRKAARRDRERGLTDGTPRSVRPAAKTKRRLSIIIPARNEEHAIGPVLDRLRNGIVWEVIVVDGGSYDRTRDIARHHGATVIQTGASRGRQLNAGAEVATGDTLLFLHADTLLPPGFEEHVFSILARQDTSAGAFCLGIDGCRRALRLIEKTVYYRSKFLQMPYGDQAIFLRAELFHRIGGYPDWPAMEDYALVRRLRRVGRIEIAQAAVLTSARRWLDHGVWRTTLRNQACIAAYRLGISPHRIARFRTRRKERGRSRISAV